MKRSHFAGTRPANKKAGQDIEQRFACRGTQHEHVPEKMFHGKAVLRQKESLYEEYPITVPNMPMNFFPPAGSFKTALARIAVMAGVAPVKIPASPALVRIRPVIRNMRNKNIPKSA